MLREIEGTEQASVSTGENTSAAIWERFFNDRSVENRNRLVLFYAPLVRLVASRVGQRMRSFQSIEELCSCGQFGLIDAIERFDPSEGNKFSTYASIRIQGAIIDELRRDDILPKRMRARVKTFQVAVETLETNLHRSPTIKEIAEYLGTSVEEALETSDLANTSNYLVSLSVDEEDPRGVVIESPMIEPEKKAELQSMRETMKAALLRLTERQRQVLVLHFLEGFQKSEIADTLHIDRSRVTQLLQQGLHNLRIELGDSQSLLSALDA